MPGTICRRPSDGPTQRAIGVTVALLLLAGSLRAQPPVAPPAPGTASPDTGLRIEALQAMARSANPRVAAATAAARALRARTLTATRPPDPRLQVGWMNRRLPGLAPMTPLGMTQLQLVQMVPTAGKLGVATRAAHARAAGAELRSDDLAWEVRADVASAFYELYRVERSLGIATRTRRLMQDVGEVAAAMYAVGEVPQADVLKARVEVARMTEELIAMEAMRQVALARLGGLLNREFDSTTVPAILPRFPAAVPPREVLEAAALAARPMLRAGEADLVAAEADRALAYRELIPDLEVGLQYGQQGATGAPERMLSLMLGVSVPIFARRRQLPMRAEAEAMTAMTAAELAAMRADTRARVATAHAEWIRTRNLQRLYRTAVLPQARAAVEASLAAYRVGAVNLMTLLDDQSTVNRYEQELAALEAMEGIVLAELEMLLGRELGDGGLGVDGAGGDR